MNHIPKVLAINDLSSYGRAALTVVTPIISAMGIQVIPLPTAVLSTHGAFPGYVKLDLTNTMLPFLKHWESLQIQFDAIYSGYLASYEQIDLICKYLNQSNFQGKILVDPVLGDNGRLFGSIKPEMVEGMQRLVRHAHIVTPNITELFLLLGEKYEPYASKADFTNMARALSNIGPSKVVVTGIRLSPEDANMHILYFDAENQDSKLVTHTYFPASFPGTGDVFSSTLLGYILNGVSFEVSVEKASQFVSHVVKYTFEQNTNVKEGLHIEPHLRKLWTSNGG